MSRTKDYGDQFLIHKKFIQSILLCWALFISCNTSREAEGEKQLLLELLLYVGFKLERVPVEDT